MAIADIAINIFAIESSVLRAEKIMPTLSEAKKGAVTAAVKVFTFNASEQAATAARKAAFFIEEGDNLTMPPMGLEVHQIRRCGGSRAKRQLADAAIEAERCSVTPKGENGNGDEARLVASVTSSNVSVRR